MSRHSSCETNVRQLIEMEAQVTVTPVIRPGKPTISNVESDIRKHKSKKKKGKKTKIATKKRTFTLTQVICVEIPLMFDVEVDVDKGIVNYDTPNIGPYELKELLELHELKESPELHELKESPELHELKESPELHELKESSELHELKESPETPNILNLLNPRNLVKLLNLDFFRNCLYHTHILPNIMYYIIRKVGSSWRILVVVETPEPIRLL